MSGHDTTNHLTSENKRLRKQVQVKDSLIEILTSEKMKLTLRLNDKIKEIGSLQSKLMDLEYKTAKILI
jgi:chromosome segregation ATPase